MECGGLTPLSVVFEMDAHFGANRKRRQAAALHTATNKIHCTRCQTKTVFLGEIPGPL
jgi:hypothetical protein